MMMSPTEELFAAVERAQHDPAFLTDLKKRLVESGLWEAMGGPMPKAKLNRAPPAAPATNEITAVRAGLWDNWPTGERTQKHPNRFAMTIELWTLPGDQIEAVTSSALNFTFKSNVSLMGQKALKAQLRNLRKPRINALSNVDPAYLDGLAELLTPDNADMMIGMINTNISRDDSEYHRGIYYHPNQFVAVKMDGSRIEWAKLALTDGVIDLAPFVTHDCNDAPLKGVVAQSRLDRIGFDESWGS